MSAEQLTETATKVAEQPEQEAKEMFIITPLKTCPHVEQISDIPSGGLDANAACKKCSKVGENWVCLKCYEVNCSHFVEAGPGHHPYPVEGHAMEHSDLEEHPLALSYADISVWCYPCNAYIDNKAFKKAKLLASTSKHESAEGREQFAKLLYDKLLIREHFQENEEEEQTYKGMLPAASRLLPDELGEELEQLRSTVKEKNAQLKEKDEHNARKLTKFVDALLCERVNTSSEEHIRTCIPVLFSLEDEEDVRTMLAALLGHTASGKNPVTAATLLKKYIENAEIKKDAFTDSQLELLVSGLLSQYNADNGEVLSKVVDSLNALVKQLRSSDHVKLVLVLKRTLKALSGDVKQKKAATTASGSQQQGLARALCQLRGLQPVLTILREGMLFGGVEIKEVAANCIGQAIQMSDAGGLKPHVVDVAGPLIRVLGPAPVKIAAMSALVTLLEKFGAEMVDELFPFIEGELNKLATAGAAHDNLRQGLVILIGTLAQILQEDDTKVRKIFTRLIEALSTPSQQIQEAVAACLPALVPFLRADARSLVENMFLLLTNAESYGERRGAAYGIASIIKGLGVVAIKELNVNARLKELLAQKQKPLHREGALLCIEMLCGTIGKLFEPYLVHLLPDLLNAFADSSEAVRKTADDTAKAMMRSLSAQGVKLLLPSLLRGLDNVVEIKEVAANCIGQAIQMSDAGGLKPHVVDVAGPLIRVLGEKHPDPVKIAAMNALIKLLEKMSTLLKPFLPQMQSMFLKILADPASANLRQLAAQGIGHILAFHPKPDALFKELNKLRDMGSDEMDLGNDKLLEDLVELVKQKL